MTQPLCFVVIPFRPELNFFYLYIQDYLTKKHGIQVVRGDHQVLTKALIDKIRGQIVAADVILGDVTGSNPNVLYEIGFAHASNKPVIFLTQEPPEKAPVDIRQYDYIQYDLGHHVEFLENLDNAIANVFAEKYQPLYEEAKTILAEFNSYVKVVHQSCSLKEFQARVVRGEQTEALAQQEQSKHSPAFLLPKVLQDATNHKVLEDMSNWIADIASQPSDKD